MTKIDATGRRPRDGFEFICFFGVVLACAFSTSVNIADPDLWGHIRFGRDALQEGLPATTTYSYTAVGHRWVNHENLAEFCSAIVADTTGARGLLLGKCVAGVLVMWLVMRHAKQRGIGLLTIGFVALIVSANLSAFWAPRPQLFSFVFYTLELALLSWCFAGWEGKWRLPQLAFRDSDRHGEPLSFSWRRMQALWAFPVLLCVWANSHGGFLAGFGVLGAYLGMRSVEALACRGRRGWGIVGFFAAITVVSGLATLLNPYGTDLHAWLYRSLIAPRPEIVEWHPPLPFSDMTVPLWLILALFAITLSMTRRSWDATHLAILWITLFEASKFVRHAPFFALAFGFFMTLHVDEVLQRLGFGRPDEPETADDPKRRSPLRWCVVAGLATTFAILLAKLAIRLDDMPVRRNEYPVSAAEFIARHDLRGKMVATFNWSQYLIGAFGANDPRDGLVFQFDGRYDTSYPFAMVDQHFDFVLGPGNERLRYRDPASPPPLAHRVLEHGTPDLVLLCRQQPHSEWTMYRNREQWTLLYQDAMAQLWGRASKYDDPLAAEFLPPSERRITNEIQTGSVRWPGFPARKPRSTNTADARPNSQPELAAN